MTEEPLPPHKQLYQDIFDWCQDIGSLPLASDMDELISIVLKSRTTPAPVDVEALKREVFDSVGPQGTYLQEEKRIRLYMDDAINYLAARGLLARGE